MNCVYAKVFFFLLQFCKVSLFESPGITSSCQSENVHPLGVSFIRSFNLRPVNVNKVAPCVAMLSGRKKTASGGEMLGNLKRNNAVSQVSLSKRAFSSQAVHSVAALRLWSRRSATVLFLHPDLDKKWSSISCINTWHKCVVVLWHCEIWQTLCANGEWPDPGFYRNSQFMSGRWKSEKKKLWWKDRLHRAAQTQRQLWNTPASPACHLLSWFQFVFFPVSRSCPLPVLWVCVCYFLCCCSESLLCHFLFDLKDFSLLRLGSFEQLLFVLFTLQRFTWILFVKVCALFSMALLKCCVSSVFSEQSISCRKCLLAFLIG